MKKLDEFLLVVYFTNFKTIYKPVTLLNLTINNYLTTNQIKGDGYGDGYGDGSGYGNG